MPKRTLRSTLLSERLDLQDEDHLQKSLDAQKRLCETREFLSAQAVALYNPVHMEVLTGQLFDVARASGKRVVYPRVNGDHLDFFEVESMRQFVPGRFGIPEPEGGSPVSLSELDLMVVPGVGFDLHGHRLGYGRGYYDRVLAGESRRPTLVGLCFEQQVVDRLPRDPHDVCVDLLITEQHSWRFAPTNN